MNDLIKKLEAYSADKNPETKAKLQDIKDQLTAIFDEEVASISTSKALSPNELKNTQNVSEEVWALVEITNNILLNTSNGNYCTIKQKVITAARRKQHPWKKFEYTRLDTMERVFRLTWWKVTYDKPCYDENFDAYFKFSAK